MIKKKIYALLLFNLLFPSVQKKIIKSNNHSLELELILDVQTEADLFPISLLIGLPNQELPRTVINYGDKSPLHFKTSQEKTNKYNWINNQKLRNLNVATLHISPIANTNSYYRNINVKIFFDETELNYRIPDKNEVEFLKSRVLNWNIAKSWINVTKRNVSRNSLNSDGMWFQFYLGNDGIQSISFAKLSSVVPDISELDPTTFSIYMNHEQGRSRTQLFNMPIPENLVEIPIFITGEQDGSFDSSDKIIFYGRGPSGFDIINNELIWHQNIYFNSNSCWLFIPTDPQHKGKRVEFADQPESGLLIDYGISYEHFESDLINLNAGGTEWVGSPISAGSSLPISINTPDPKQGINTEIYARFRGSSMNETSSSFHQLSVLFGSSNGLQIGSTLGWSGNGARTFSESTSDMTLNDGSNLFYVKNNSSNSNSYPYIDNFQVLYGRDLKFGQNFEFLSPTSSQDTRFSFSGQSSENFYLWDITNPVEIKNIFLDSEGYANVNMENGFKKRFVLFSTDQIIDEVDILYTENQQFNSLRNNNLQANYIIIGPEIYRESAYELLTLRQPAIYASIEAIYSEFSAGNPDPMAIRSFAQWTQENWIAPSPNCVLLLGDAGYDYRNLTGNSSIIVPTIQVQSTRPYATDDLLFTIYGNIPEIASGRFPAKNPQEVSNFVEKILIMEENPEFGPWRQKITLVADDAARPEPRHGSIATGKSHTLNSEQLAETISNGFLIEKLYMMEYPEVSDASAYGVIKPDATDALINSLNSGTAILSYIGHGSSYQLAQEKLLYLDRGDINRINTGKKLPLWIVGTCSFGHFDDPLSESFSEELIRSPLNSASMVISTSRPITVTGNEKYTQDLFEAIFKNGNVSDDLIGILLQAIKDGSTEGQYFHLFGDPAMQLPMPKDTLIQISISPDTMRTLEKGSYAGALQSNNITNYGYVNLIDADRNVTRIYEIESETHSISYTLPGATLFRGQFIFSEANFSGEIITPQDISYSNNTGKLIVYIHNDNTDYRGMIDSIYFIGGESTTDQYGPGITFENSLGTRLENGDHLPLNSDLVIRITDPLGINITNESGHEILITDLNSSNINNVTNQFYYDPNSINTGTIIYSTSNSDINLKINAWDNANNPSQKSIKLRRLDNNELNLYNTFNYPNPFINFTQFTFEINQNADVRLDIYTIGGKRIKSINDYNLEAGFHYIDWDGLDQYGGRISNGVYIYRLNAKGKDSNSTFIGRCAKYQ